VLKPTLKYKDEEKNPLEEVFTNFWPLLKKTFRLYSSSDTVIEALSVTVKHAMRGLGLKFQNFLDDFLNIITKQYEVRNQ
jgi:hypothetical protein